MPVASKTTPIRRVTERESKYNVPAPNASQPLAGSETTVIAATITANNQFLNRPKKANHVAVRSPVLTAIPMNTWRFKNTEEPESKRTKFSYVATDDEIIAKTNAGATIQVRACSVDALQPNAALKRITHSMI